MIKAALDLHIHSCLSPCADNDMTPNNIVLMSKLKGLNIIAVCDHNHTGNLKAVSKVAKAHNIVFVPGLELETSEEIHLLCYFPTLLAAEKMQDVLNEHYRPVLNREDIFGEQWILDAEDKPVKKIGNLLVTSTSLDLYTSVSIVCGLGGAAVPAHVDRESYSIISNLGSIPEDLYLKTLEVSRYTTQDDFTEKYPEYKDRNFISSSDAHALGMILERVSFIELEDFSAECLVENLRANTTW
jgi:PHP family Zn ribbon phosphoesterase